MRSSLPLLSAIIVFIVVLTSMLSTIAIGGLLSGTALVVNQLTGPETGTFEIILADPIAYAKGLLSVDYQTIAQRAQSIAKSLKELDLEYSYDDTDNNVYLDVSPSVAQSFQDFVKDVISYLGTVIETLEQPNDPLKDVASMLPGPASLTRSLLLPNLLSPVNSLISLDLNQAISNISRVCNTAYSGGYDDALATALEGFGYSKNTVDQGVSYVLGVSKFCRKYVSDLEGQFKPPSSPIPDPNAVADAMITEQQTSNWRAAAAAITAAAVSGVVLGLLVAIGLAVWTYMAVDAAMHGPTRVTVREPYGTSEPTIAKAATEAESTENPLAA